LHYKTISARSFFLNIDLEKFIKLLVGFFVLGCFFAGSFFFFFRIFNYLGGLQDIGILLMNKLVSMGFLAIFVMLIISNIVTSISTLYRSPETTFLLSSPVAYHQVFTVKFIDNIFYSTWAVILLGLPLILAYGMVRDFVIWEYVFEIFCVLLPFVIIPACIGVAFSGVMFLLSRYVSPRSLTISLISVMALAVVLYFKLGKPSSLAFNVMSDWRVLNRYLGSMGVTSFPFLPSFWVSETLRTLAEKGRGSLLVYMLAMISTTLLFVNALFIAAKKYYYKTWLASVEHHGAESKTEKARIKSSRFFRLPDWLPSDFRAVLSKDLKLFTREPAQWAQFTVLLVLLVIYLINLKYFPTNLEDSYWKTLIGFANFAFSGFILATLSVRFVFPTISLEGRAFWAITSSPMPLRRVFWEKFWSAFLIFLLISEVLAFVSNLMLGLRGVLMVLTFSSVLLMSIALTSLAVGLGAAFPRFEERNPGKIASSMGGMLATIISLFYVGIMVALAAMPASGYAIYRMNPGSKFPSYEVGLAAALMLILNLTAIVVPLKLGVLSMRKRDY
jgi:ABC-2 type transport system permease protein